MKTTYHWDEDSGIATCIIEDKNGRYIGVAKCSPKDADMKNEKTGLIIAEARANIKLIKAEKSRTAQELKALNHYYHCIKDSKHFRPESYEANMLYRQTTQLKETIDSYNDIIKLQEKELDRFFQEKLKFYISVRKHRQKAGQIALNVLSEKLN